MATLIVLLFTLLSLSSAQLGAGATLPVRLSTGDLGNGTGNGFCTPQSSQVEARVRQAIVDTVTPILDRKDYSPGTCNGTGWSRVAFLNMTDPDEECPCPLTTLTSPSRGCGGHPDVSTCDSIFFTPNIPTYSQVCGRILAYQRASTDGFFNYLRGGQNTIELAYIDGISLTYGSAGFRQHIWTFAVALNEQDPNYNPVFRCPCTNTQFAWTFQLPGFIGDNYFCDTGNPGPGGIGGTYPDDPLWDGEGCGPFSTCCELNNPPWFQTTLPQTTSDNIELRLCHGIPNRDEDIAITLIEIYVK